MASKRYNVSEARRLLPQLVRTIAAEGGRIDITHRGEPRVTLLRTSDVLAKAKPSSAALPPALRVELSFPSEALPEILRGARALGDERLAWLGVEARKKGKVRRASRAKRTKP
jgi:antitoxin (DNA-binding transcriptional repressor) of toxin-antitoxin stability system